MVDTDSSVTRRVRTPLYESRPASLSIPKRSGMMTGDTWVHPHKSSTWICLHGDDPWPGHTICYHLYGIVDNEDADPMLYVGITNNIERRFAQHRASKPWWPSVHQCMLTCFVSRETALAYESACIDVDGPPHNTAGRHRR